MCAFPQQLREPLELEQLLAALSNRRPRVAYDACTVLAADYVVPRERLWALLATASRAHTRTCVVRLLARGERLDSMTWLLNAVALGNQQVRLQACKHLKRWGDAWPQVTPQCLAQFRTALHRASPALPEGLRNRLWAYVHHIDGTTLRATRLAPPMPRRAIAAPCVRATPAKVRSKSMAPQPRPLRLHGCVVLRRYNLPPQRRLPWRWLLPC